MIHLAADHKAAEVYLLLGNLCSTIGTHDGNAFLLFVYFALI